MVTCVQSSVQESKKHNQESRVSFSWFPAPWPTRIYTEPKCGSYEISEVRRINSKWAQETQIWLKEQLVHLCDHLLAYTQVFLAFLREPNISYPSQVSHVSCKNHAQYIQLCNETSWILTTHLCLHLPFVMCPSKLADSSNNFVVLCNDKHIPL